MQILNAILSILYNFYFLSGITDKNLYPLLLMSSAFRVAAEGETIFTKLDFHNAHNLVWIRNECKTAFNTGHFEYGLMPFGLVNAPDIFQVLINDVLRDMVNKHVHLDDIWIFSYSLQVYTEHVQPVLQ